MCTWNSCVQGSSDLREVAYVQDRSLPATPTCRGAASKCRCWPAAACAHHLHLGPPIAMFNTHAVLAMFADRTRTWQSCKLPIRHLLPWTPSAGIFFYVLPPWLPECWTLMKTQNTPVEAQLLCVAAGQLQQAQHHLRHLGPPIAMFNAHAVLATFADRTHA